MLKELVIICDGLTSSFTYYCVFQNISNTIKHYKYQIQQENRINQVQQIQTIDEF